MRKKRRKRYKIISIIKFFALIIGKVGDCFTVGASNEPKCSAAYLHFDDHELCGFDKGWLLNEFRKVADVELYFMSLFFDFDYCSHVFSNSSDCVGPASDSMYWTWNLLRFRAMLSWAPLDETFLLYHMNQSPWTENLDKKACTLYQPQRFRHDQLYRVSESLMLRD